MVNDQKFVLKWYDRLQFKIPVVFLLLFAVLVASIVLVMKKVGKVRLEEQAYHLITQTGNTIVADVHSRTVFAESLAKSLANLGKQLPLNVESYTKMVPMVLDINGTESFIAGGGIWPEPYKFSKDIERHSFFWGRNEKEKLQYYDNYNDPNGTGYHNEEWYVPAKYLSKDKNFWSKSYMDPFTYQPMVTCTVPMYRNGEFFGVSTVDFKLEGLGNFLEQASSRLGGYSFVVDRNGKFLSFPKESMVKVYLVDSLGNKTQEFIYVDQMAQTNPLFKPIADGISQVNSEIIKKAAGTDKGKFSEALAASIDSESYQINHQEAEMIAAAITDPLIDMNNNYQMKQFSIDNDVLLSKPCTVFIFHVPQTYWKVITVIPISEAVAISTSIYYTILSFIIGITAAVILAGFLIFYRSFVRPLRLMSKQLRSSVEANAGTPEKIKYAGENELGLLAHLFNLRGDQLADTLASLYAIQNNLEKSIEQRTMELTNANQQLETDITKRKEAEMQLRDSQEKLQLVMDNVPQSIFWKDRNSVYISCNSSFAKDAGLKNMQDITGKTDYDFAWKKEEADFFRQCDAEIMQSDTPRYHIIESVLQANGRQAWVDVNKVPMHDSDNNVIGIIGTYEDITERKLAEEELLKKTALLEAQLNASIDGILVVNENNKKIIVNQQFANLFSVPQSIMDDEDDTSLLKYVVSLTKYPEIVLEKIKYLYDHQNETSRDETELKNGMVLDRYSAPILGKNEKNYGRIWTFRDITTRKQAEDALRHSEAMFHALYDTTSDAVMMLDDEEGKFFDCNKAAMAIFGCSDKEEFYSKHPTDFSPLKQPCGTDSMTLANQQIALAMEKGTNHFEWMQKRIDTGKEFPADVLINVIELDGKRVIHTVIRDITARKQAEEEMEKMLQWQQGINTLQQSLLAQASLEDRLKTITDSIVQIFDADFCRIWLIKPGDMCEDCVHAEAKEGPHICRYRDKCLHLLASSGRYTHTDGKTHRRVPFGCYKIGLVASGVDHKLITNDAQNDPRVHNNEWARELGLTSFAGYQLKTPGGEILGVLAMFAKHTITPAEDAILDGLGSDVAFVIQQSIADSKLRHSEAMFHALYDTTSDAVMMLGDGKFFDCNKATMAIFGCADKDDFYSKHPADFSPLKQPCGTDSMTLANQQIALAMEKGTNHFEWIHKRIDTGKEFPADVLINAMELDGKLVVHTVVRDITERKQKEEQLKEIQDELLDASRRAGMAEVATDVLHNVGNVLNSINVSTTLIGETISKSEIQNLKKVTNMIEEHLQDINTFFAQDPKGRYVPSYLIKTVKLLANEQESVIGKLGSLVEDVNHIKSIVNMHQEYAKVSGVEISTTVDRVIEDAIRINLAGLKRHMIRIVRDYAELGEVSIDKQKVIQILVNLIGNAKYALSNNEITERILTIRSYKHGDNHLGIEVIDNGEGIPSENLIKIFQHGFTTKKQGHGFGLHSCALAAKEMKGSLAVHSYGLGHGAMFTLELPFNPVEIIQCTR